jgi:hypothetical protein
VIRASVAAPSPIVVGETVRVNVTVLVPNYFTGEPEFPPLNLDNAIVVLPEERPEHSNENINGESYAGITKAYLIYPQQPGSFKLPHAQIVVKYAVQPPKSAEVRIPLPDLSFEAVIPPEAAGLDYFLPTASLMMAQKFDRPIKDLKVGDTLTRTVTITASKLKAMMIPPTRFEAADGIVIYPKQPAVDDITSKQGEFVQGRRVDTATYLIRKEGSYTLPEIQIQWWDLAGRKVRTARLPAIHLTAAPNPAYIPELPPEPEPVAATVQPKVNPIKKYLRLAEIAGIVLVSFAVLAWAWFRFGARIFHQWMESRRAYRNSEAALFAQLRTASRASNAETAYTSLLAWLRRFRPGVALGQFLANSADAELTQEVETLASQLYGGGTSAWSGKRMDQALQRVRSRRQYELSARPALPPLNPKTSIYSRESPMIQRK